VHLWQKELSVINQQMMLKLNQMIQLKMENHKKELKKEKLDKFWIKFSLGENIILGII